MKDTTDRTIPLSADVIQDAIDAYDKHVQEKGPLFTIETLSLTDLEQRALIRKYWTAMAASIVFVCAAIGTGYFIYQSMDSGTGIWIALLIFVFIAGAGFREAMRYKNQTGAYRIKGVITDKYPYEYDRSYTYYFVLSKEQIVRVLAEDYDRYKLGDILDMECLSFSDPTLPRETKKLGNIM